MKEEKSRKDHVQSIKGFERMELMSMIPLDISDSSISLRPKSAIETDYELYRKLLSRYARNLDYGVKNDCKKFVRGNTDTSNITHKITSYESALESIDYTTPDPGTYSPDFNAIKPKIRATNIGIVHKKTKVKQLGKSTAASPTKYSLRLRSKERLEAPAISELEELNPIKPGKPIAVPRFKTQLARKIEKPFPTALNPNVPFYLKPLSQPKSVYFDRQASRKDLFVTDHGRDYTDGVERGWAYLNKRSASVPNFSRQSDRDRLGNKNQRVAFLESIDSEQKEMLDKLKPKREHVVTKGRCTSSFDRQGKRKLIFDMIKALPESKFPINTEKSFRYLHGLPKTLIIKTPIHKMNTKK